MGIRLYQAADEPRCLEIFDSNVPEFFGQNERQPFVDWLRKGDRDPYWVLEREGEIIACGGVFSVPEKKTAGLAWGMVLNRLHRKGYGSRLTKFRLQKLEELYPDFTYEIDTAHVTEAFYQRFGFKTVKVIPDGWGPGLDQCLMRREPRRLDSL